MLWDSGTPITITMWRCSCDEISYHEIGVQKITTQHTCPVIHNLQIKVSETCHLSLWLRLPFPQCVSKVLALPFSFLFFCSASTFVLYWQTFYVRSWGKTLGHWANVYALFCHLARINYRLNDKPVFCLLADVSKPLWWFFFN